MIVKTDKSDFESYLSDAANIKGNCDKVYFCESEEDIESLVLEANKSLQPITISGARTGLNGGSVPKEGILLSLERMNKILEINTSEGYAVVEPGVSLSSLQSEVKKVGLFYPPDPTENNCSIGGNVANNASGARTFKYGATREFVREISIILPEGIKINLERGKCFFDGLSGEFDFGEGIKFRLNLPNYSMPNVKHAAGYFVNPYMDLIDLFIGAEGTLGIITKIKLKLIPLPQNVLSMIIFFNSEENLFSFVDDVREKSLQVKEIVDFREIEFFDKNTLEFLRGDYNNIPQKTSGAVWIEQEYDETIEDEIFITIDELVKQHDGDAENIWFATNEKERNELGEFRHKVPLKVNDLISSRGLIKVGTDTAVPKHNFRDFFYFAKNLIERHKLDYIVYGHIGNSHLHFNMLPKTEEELLLCKELYGKICKESVALEGTISAEHGIGKLKRNYLLEMLGKDIIINMVRIKKTLDPNIILNVGNIFEENFLNEC